MSKGIGAVQAASMLLIGIFIGQKFKPSLLLCLILFSISMAGGIFFFMRGRKYKLDQPPKKISRLLFCISLLAFGMVRTAIVSREHPAGSIENFTQEERVTFNGTVIAPPTVTASSTTLRVKVDRGQDPEEGPTAGKLLLVFYYQPKTLFQYGDRLQISGKVILPPDTGTGFSYRTYLERDGITAIINNPHTEILPGSGGKPLLSGIYQLRSILLERIYRLFDQTVLRKLIHQWWAPLFMLPFILFYTILVGGNAAVVRAAIMCSLSIIGMTIGRTGNGINTLALTAAVMALVKPGILFDLGFQLSVTATAGILFFSEPICNAVRWMIAKIFPKMSENTLSGTVDVLKDLCILSISAQIFTM